MIIAGHDTTAGALTWLLWELAKDQESQHRLREEILAIRAGKTGDIIFTPADYDNMPFLNAVLKEGLRFHPISVHLFRQASKDDVMPLSEPVVTKDGRVIQEITVSKGQTVRCSVRAYNRLQSVWGEDADTWRPGCWINMEKHKVSLGMMANLMTFGAGLKGCIGWKFS
jgi:cytochrome P450